MESFGGGRTTPNAQLRAEERLQRALAIDTVGVLFFTLDGGLTDANAAFERMSGYTREELRAMVHWKELTPDGTRKKTAGVPSWPGSTRTWSNQSIRTASFG